MILRIFDNEPIEHMRIPFFIWLLLTVMVIATTGCLVSEDNAVPDPARLRVLNLVPERTFTFSGNEDVLASNIPYDSITPYGYAYPGFYDIRITGSENNTLSARQVIQSRARYSFFIFPDSSSRANNITGFKLSVITDDNLYALRDSFYIRFMHYSPNAPTVHVEPWKQRGLSANEDLKPLSIFRQRSFNDISVYSNYATYQKLEIGNYRFRFRNLTTIDSAELIVADRRSFRENTYYTMYLEGFADGTNNYALKIKIDSVGNTNN